MAWGVSKDIDKIFLTQKRAIRAIFGLKFSESTTDAFSTLKILTVHQLYKYTCSSLMWDFDHGHLPKHISKFCIKTSNFHTINTRAAASNKLVYSTKYIAKTHTHGVHMLKVLGPKIFNDMVEQGYVYTHSKKYFLSQYKNYLLS